MTWTQAFGIAFASVGAGAMVYGMWRGVAWFLTDTEEDDRRDEEEARRKDPQNKARMTGA